MALAPGFWALVIARFIGGYAFGTLLLAPIYIAEIAPARLRGALVSVNQLNIVIGFSAAYFANFYILELCQSGAAWVADLGIDDQTGRWMLGVEALPALGYLMLLSFVPESPRWLDGPGAEGRGARGASPAGHPGSARGRVARNAGEHRRGHREAPLQARRGLPARDADSPWVSA